MTVIHLMTPVAPLFQSDHKKGLLQRWTHHLKLDRINNYGPYCISGIKPSSVIQAKQSVAKFY